MDQNLSGKADHKGGEIDLFSRLVAARGLGLPRRWGNRRRSRFARSLGFDLGSSLALGREATPVLDLEAAAFFFFALVHRPAPWPYALTLPPRAISSRRRMRSSSSGWVENRRVKPCALSGLTINRWAVLGLAASGMRSLATSSLRRALASSSGLWVSLAPLRSA